MALTGFFNCSRMNIAKEKESAPFTPRARRNTPESRKAAALRIAAASPTVNNIENVSAP